jgi:hypothetical protein
VSESSARQTGERSSEPCESENPQASNASTDNTPEETSERPPEIGGPKGPEPTRYGDWEVKGRCSDF